MRCLGRNLGWPGHPAWPFHHSLCGHCSGLRIPACHRTGKIRRPLSPRQATPFPLPCPFKAFLRSRRTVFASLPRSKVISRGVRVWRAEQRLKQVPGHLCLSASSAATLPPWNGPGHKGGTLLTLQSGKVDFGEAIPSSARGPMSRRGKAWVQADLVPSQPESSGDGPHPWRAS